MGRWPSRGILITLVGVLFMLVAAVAATTDPRVVRVPVPPVEPLIDAASPATETDSQDSARRQEGADPRRPSTPSDNPVLMWLGGFGLLLVAGLVVGLLWRALGGRVTLRRTADRSRTDGREQVRAAVAAGIDELDANGGDPRAAVIACWLRLERAAATAGTRRQPSDTPGELIARMLAEHQVSGPVLDRFGVVYRRARYAPHDVDEAMREQARTALRRVHSDLSEQVPTSGPPDRGAVRA